MAEGAVFTCVCHSFCPRRDGCTEGGVIYGMLAQGGVWQGGWVFALGCRPDIPPPEVIRHPPPTRLLLLPVADLGGRRGHAPPPPRAPKFFRFHAVFRKIWQNHMLAPSWGVGAPPPGEILDPPLAAFGMHCTGMYSCFESVLCCLTLSWSPVINRIVKEIVISLCFIRYSSKTDKARRIPNAPV